MFRPGDDDDDDDDDDSNPINHFGKIQKQQENPESIIGLDRSQPKATQSCEPIATQTRRARVGASGRRGAVECSGKSRRVKRLEGDDDDQGR